MISGFLNPSLSPKTNIIYLLEHQDTSKESRKTTVTCSEQLFYKPQKLENQLSDIFGKKRGPKHDEDPFKNILKRFEMKSISVKTHDMDIL